MFESKTSGLAVLDDPPPDADAVITAMLDADRAVRVEQVRKFCLAASYADMHSTIDQAGWWPMGGPRLINLGGDGAPEVVDLCLYELSAALRVTPESAEMLIGDALAVRHRFPHAWTALAGLRMFVWQARELARSLWELSFEDAIWIDAQLASCYGSMSWRRTTALAEGLKLQRRPDLATTERERRLASRRVCLEDSSHGCLLYTSPSPRD